MSERPGARNAAHVGKWTRCCTHTHTCAKAASTKWPRASRLETPASWRVLPGLGVHHDASKVGACLAGLIDARAPGGHVEPFAVDAALAIDVINVAFAVDEKVTRRFEVESGVGERRAWRTRADAPIRLGIGGAPG